MAKREIIWKLAQILHRATRAGDVETVVWADAKLKETKRLQTGRLVSLPKAIRPVYGKHAYKVLNLDLTPTSH